MAQTKTSQRTPTRVAANREQARRGGPVAPSSGGASKPLTAAGAGGRGRRGNLSLLNFFREVRSELRKVIWPTRRETLNLTVVVLALSAAVGMFLGGIDFLFQEFFRLLLGATGGGF